MVTPIVLAGGNGSRLWLLSTLRRYIEAMGDELDLVARFPNRPQLHLRGLGETRENGANNRP